MSGRRFLAAVFAAMMLGPFGSAPALAGSAVATACAARDLVVFSLIEKHGEDRSLPAEIVADAAMRLLDARVACRDGQEAEALAIYAVLGARLAGADGRR
jgi:hypothetical protein